MYTRAHSRISNFFQLPRILLLFLILERPPSGVSIGCKVLISKPKQTCLPAPAFILFSSRHEKITFICTLAVFCKEAIDKPQIISRIHRAINFTRVKANGVHFPVKFISAQACLCRVTTGRLLNPTRRKPIWPTTVTPITVCIFWSNMINLS